MEDDGEATPRTPFWLQSTTNVSRVDHYRRRVSSLFFNSGVLIFLLLSFAVVSMVFIIPSAISFTSHIFRPNLVKKSWDSVNFVLVLFALAFGFLGRNINNDHKSSFHNGYYRSRSDLSVGAPVSTPSTSTPHQWYDFPEQPIGFTTDLRRHRSSSSYPDLRELSPLWNHHASDPWRFSDDTHLNGSRVSDSDRHFLLHLSRREPDDVAHVDTVLDLSKENSYTSSSTLEDGPYSLPRQLPSSEPLSPQAPASTPTLKTYHDDVADDEERSSRLKVDKILLLDTEAPVTVQSLPSFEDLERKGRNDETRKRGKGERRRAKSSEPNKLVSKINPTPEPSPPPSISVFQDSYQKNDGGNAVKESFASIYQKKKKKRQRQRSVGNLDTILYRSPPSAKFEPPATPPPRSGLNKLFTSKKERRKKLLSPSPASPPPPPPPPPPMKPIITRVSPFITEKPRVPLKMNILNITDGSSSGAESPLGRIPPPPPMPPFKMPDWKFAVEGDYVRLQSTLSSGSGSPDGDEGQSPASAASSPMFCPSPDVNTKADSFIARFRAGLKLEKINSFNQNQGLRMSNLGPGPS